MSVEISLEADSFKEHVDSRTYLAYPGDIVVRGFSFHRYVYERLPQKQRSVRS